MMNIQTIKATMNGLVSKYGEEEAIERFLEKHSEYEGEMYMVLNGEDELPETMKYTAPEDELPEVEDEAEIIVETVTEVNEGEAPKVEKTAKKKADKKPTEVKVKKEKVVVEKAPKAPSKAEQARAIYAASEDKSRAAVTKRFVEELGLTPAGASTYFQNIKKATAA